MEEKKWAYEIVNGKAIIPQGTKKIVANAFKYCKELTSVEIPEGVTTIGKYAFNGCERLQEVTLPESLEYIDENAFGDCKSLGDITIGNNIKKIDKDAFIHSTIDSISCFKEEPLRDLLAAANIGGIRKVIISGMDKYARVLEMYHIDTFWCTREEFINKFEDCGGITYKRWKELEKEEAIKKEKKTERLIISCSIGAILFLLLMLLFVS